MANLKIPSQLLEPQILANSVQDLSFFMKVRQYLDTNGLQGKSYFSDEKYQEVFNMYSRFFAKFGKKPKKNTLKALIDRTENEEEIKLYKNSIVDKMYNTSSDEIDSEYIEAETISFIKQNRVYEAMVESQQDVEDENYDNIVNRMEDAIRVSFDKDLGVSINDFDNVLERISSISEEEALSTGYNNLDSFLDGGFHPKELYVFSAIPGTGKTMLLMNFAINAYLQGKKALIYTFETSIERLMVRGISNLTNLSKSEIFLDEEGAKEKLKDFQEENELGDIRIKEYGANEASANDLLAHLYDLQMYEDFIPDVIFIDHILIMAANDRRLSPDNSYKYYKTVAEEIRNIGKKLGISVVSATQINREGMSDKGGSKAILTGKEVSESRGIYDTVDGFFPMAQTARDKQNNRLFLIGDKNRNDQSGWRIQYNIDYEHMKISEDKVLS